jgi:hypothetical protein
MDQAGGGAPLKELEKIFFIYQSWDDNRRNSWGLVELNTEGVVPGCPYRLVYYELAISASELAIS